MACGTTAPDGCGGTCTGPVCAPGGGGGGCFAAGTPVLMGDGSEKAIDQIKAGDQVVAWNEKTHEKFTTTVTETLHHDARNQQLYKVKLEDGRSFTVNDNHPIYVAESGLFIMSRDIVKLFKAKKTISLLDSNGNKVKIVEMKAYRGVIPVFNLHVKGISGPAKGAPLGIGHNYFVDGVLVHNFGANARVDEKLAFDNCGDGGAGGPGCRKY